MGIAVGVSHLSTRLSSKATALPKARAQQQEEAPRAASPRALQELVRSGAVRAIPPRDAAAVLRTEEFRLVDVRPAWEWEKARVRGCIHVPLFVEDTGMDPITLLKKWVHFGYIGLWTGQKFTTINDRFVEQVEEAVPDKDDKLLVACGEGLRSMIAVRMLHEVGYRNLGWLAGGFNRSKADNFSEVEGSTKLQYATVGGVSYVFLQLLLLLKVL